MTADTLVVVQKVETVAIVLPVRTSVIIRKVPVRSEYSYVMPIMITRRDLEV